MKHQHRRRRAFLLMAVLLAAVLLMGGGALLASALIADVRRAYVDTILGAGKEPAFLLTLAFLSTFGVVRLITYSIHYRRLIPATDGLP